MTSSAVTSPIPAPAGPTWFGGGRQAGIRAAMCALLIAVAATSGVQGMGYTSTVLSGICLLLAPAYLLMTTTVADRVFIGLAALGTAAFVVSFVLNGVNLVDQRVMQWPAFALYFIGFTVLAGRDLTAVFSIAAGVALGSCFYFLTAGLPALGAPDVEAFWKYAFAPWLTVLVMYALVVARVRLGWQAGILVAIAVFSLAMNYRSHALTCFAAAAVVATLTFGHGVGRKTRFAVAGIVILVLGNVIPAIARAGLAGQTIKAKTELQDASGAPALLAGRTEPPLSFSAIAERPWFGWGSANNITADVFDRATRLAQRIGFDPSIDLEYQWHLPNGDTSLHSTLLNAWAEGGVFAALLPIMLLTAALAIVWNCDRFGRWLALASVIAVQAVWDLLFSPTSYNILPMLAVLAVAFAATHLPQRADGDREPAEGGRR